LVLSFYYEPDLCAGSFRTTAFINELRQNKGVEIEVITTAPNRYSSFLVEAPIYEEDAGVKINRIILPSHDSGMLDQANAFLTYYAAAMKIVSNNDYDVIYATSSRLFTAFLGSRIARKKKLPLYLDIRDIFVDTIGDIFSRKVTWLIKPIFSVIERYSFSEATIINLVSEGFRGYFVERYPHIELRMFTNGIDDEFMNVSLKLKPDENNKPINILYAGNVGEGQGLHRILPNLSKSLEGKVIFSVIGDGGRMKRLINALDENTSVIMLPPVDRKQLILEYKKADILFLHLNDYPAFKKVLPSKIFEYAAIGKPILAGVSGYAADFLQSEVENSAVFHPGDDLSALNAMSKLIINDIERSSFKLKFSRSVIMKNMTNDLLEFSKNARK
jgi:glycosyltransferase involved in cell wall biosynthesis